MHFILTITCQKELIFFQMLEEMGSQHDIIFNGTMFFDANETVAKHSAYPKRPFEVHVFFISYSGLGFFVWFEWVFFSAFCYH